MAPRGDSGRPWVGLAVVASRTCRAHGEGVEETMAEAAEACCSAALGSRWTECPSAELTSSFNF